MKFDRRQLMVYAVTDRAWTGKMSLCEQVEAALKGGATMVQMREKGLTNDTVQDYLEEARSLRALTERYMFEGMDEQNIGKTNLPTAVVEAVDPIVLNMKLVDVCECRPCDCELTEIPPCICACFGCDLCFGNDGKRIYVTLGQFSIIRLERDSQLLMPVYDYCMPEKECTCGGCEDDPCEIFRHVKFPVNEFFPPNSPAPIPETCRELKGCCG